MRWCSHLGNVEDELQEAGGRLLGGDGQQDRQRQDRADQIFLLAAMQDPRGEQQERVGDEVQQIDDAEQQRRQAEAARVLLDMLLAGLHLDNCASCRPARADCRSRSTRLGALDERREKRVIGVGGVIRAGPWPASEIGTTLATGTVVDRDDVVARLDAGGARRRADREADLGQIVFVEDQPGAAADASARYWRSAGQGGARCRSAGRRWRAAAPGTRTARTGSATGA